MPQFLITSPEGKKYKVTAPDGATQQDAIKFVQSGKVPEMQAPTTQPQQEPQDLTQRIGESVGQRMQNIQDIRGRTQSGERTVFEEPIPMASQLISGAGDVSGIVADAVTPDIVQRALTPPQMVKDAFFSMPGPNLIPKIIQAASSLQENYPRVADQVLGGANVFSTIVGSPIAGKAAKSTVNTAGDMMVAAGSAAEKSGIAKADKIRGEFLEKLVVPDDTKNTTGFRRKEEIGLNKTKTPVLNEKDIAIRDAVSRVEGVKKSNTFEGNYNAIQDVVTKEADGLLNSIKANDVEISHARVLKDLDDTIKRVSGQISLSGDAGESAKVMAAKFRQILKTKPQTASGLFEARREFDSWLTSEKEAFFEPTLKGGGPKYVAQTNAGLAIRGAMNDLVKKRVNNVDVDSSLDYQSNLLSALDRIEPKKFKEGGSRTERAMKKLQGAMTAKGMAAGALGLAGIGTTYLVGATPFVVSGGLLYVGSKALTSSQARKALGESLKASGKAIGGKEYKAAMELADSLPDTIPEKLLLLPSPDKMPTLPMTETQINIARAKARAKGTPNTPGVTPLSVKPKPTPDQVPMKMLPAPKREFVVTREGRARPQKDAEIDKATQGRQRDKELGVTPGVRKNITRIEIRKKVGPAWDKLNQAEKNKINSQINESWKSNKKPIGDIISQAKKDVEDLAKAKGEPMNQTVIGEALAKAKVKKANNKDIGKNPFTGK